MRKGLAILAIVLAIVGLAVYWESYSAETVVLTGEEKAGGAFLLMASAICWLVALFYHPSKRSALV